VGTKITNVPYAINNPGFYYLGENLTYRGSSDAITVSANDVTLDLMGYSLTYTSPNPGKSGININVGCHCPVEIS
jgi:hypothetical protein